MKYGYWSCKLLPPALFWYEGHTFSQAVRTADKAPYLLAHWLVPKRSDRRLTQWKLLMVLKVQVLWEGQKIWKNLPIVSTAIPYRASTGPVQGFPCEVFHTGKNLFSLQGTPVLIAGTPVFITGISLWENFTGKTLFSLQEMGLQCSANNLEV